MNKVVLAPTGIFDGIMVEFRWNFRKFTSWKIDGVFAKWSQRSDGKIMESTWIPSFYSIKTPME